MYPFYAGYIPDFDLPQDDINGIQAIYGQPDPRETTTTPSTTTTTPPRPPPRPTTTREPTMPDMCRDGRIDAITTQIIDGSSVTHVFRGRYYMQVDEQGIKEGFPRPIYLDWPGISSVDAALTMEYEFYNGRYVYRKVQNIMERILSH